MKSKYFNVLAGILIKYFTLPLLLIMLFSISLSAQNNTEGLSIQGIVICERTNTPLAGVLVYSSNQLYSTTSNKDGRFVLSMNTVKQDSIVVHFRILGYQELQKIFKNSKENITVKLKEDNLWLPEVNITATKKKSIGSEYEINSQAIGHLQATNLENVMQLLPGQLLQNPSFNNPSQIILRQAVKLHSNSKINYGEKEAMNSLGLKTIIDGMPQSNNANLQLYNIADTYTLNASNIFSTVAGRGLDMRQFSVDNIESITVIPGIPSAKYGDLTTGVVIVETKSGKSPLELQIKSDPRLIQAGIDKGFKIKKDGSSINMHIDYTKSLKAENEEDFAYKKINTNLIYSKTFFKKNQLVTKSNFSYGSTFDDFNTGVINMKEEEKIRSSERYLILTTRGKCYVNKKWLKKIEYQLGYNRKWQNSEMTRYRSEPMQAIPTAYTDTIMPVNIVPYTYLYDLEIEGIPTRYYAKLNAEFLVNFLKCENHILIGSEWTTEKNDGKGKVFDINNPPGFSSYNSLRPRPYKDIPSLNTFSLYIENDFKFELFGRSFNGNIGLRYDNYDPVNNSSLKKHEFFSPRMNISYEVVNKLRLKAGWGKTAKSIPMLYLYPEKAYFDFLNLNYYNSLGNGQKEYFFLNTTRVFETENPDLKVATANKKEIGLNYRNSKFSFDITFFDEKVNNAYTLTREPVLLSRDNYELTEYVDAYHSKYRYIKTDTLLNSYTYPSNDKKVENKGVEFQVDIPEIKAIKTSFVLNGSYVQTKNEYIVPHIHSSSWNSKVFPVFKAGDGYHTEMFSTNLTAIHHIPELRYVVSLSMQTIWNEKNYSYYAPDSEYPVYLIKNGKKDYELSEKEREDYRRDINTGMIKESKPPLFLFNLRLTKEIGDKCKVMVSINNLFFSNPIYKSKRYENYYYTRNPGVYYGFKLLFKI